ncbi:MAG: sensor histidine kinase [Candidatus Odinarchaeota archaeon]
MLELAILTLVVALFCFTIVLTTIYFFDHVEKKYLFMLVFTILAYSGRLLFRVFYLLSSEYRPLLDTVTTSFIFLTLAGLLTFYSALLDKQRVKMAIFFYSYTLFCLFATVIIVSFLEVPARKVSLILLILPYISVLCYEIATSIIQSRNKKMPVWFLSRMSRMTMAAAIALIVVTELLQVFGELSTHHLIMWVVAFGLLHVGFVLGSFRTTAYVLNNLNHDYLIIASRGQILALSPAFKKNLPSGSAFSGEKPSVRILDQIVDLDDLHSFRALRTLQSTITGQDFKETSRGEEQLVLRFKKKMGSNRDTFILNTVSCSILSVKKYAVHLVLFEPLDLTSENLQQGHAGRSSNEYLSIMTHNMKSILTTASGYISLLKELDQVEKPLAEYEEVEKSLSRLDELVDRISIVTKDGRGEYPLTITKVGIKQLVQQVKCNLEPFMLTKKIKLEMHGQPPEEYSVRADRELLTVAVENLVHNALKYSPEESTVRLTCSVATNKDGKQTITLEIIDQGAGIPEDEQCYLFTPNFRASNVNGTCGNGKGLYQAKQIVERFGGKLEVVSTGTGKGTTAILTLDLVGSRNAK